MRTAEPRRVVAAAIGGAVLLAACGDVQDLDPEAQDPTPVEEPTTDDDAAAAPEEDPPPVVAGPDACDLVTDATLGAFRDAFSEAGGELARRPGLEYTASTFVGCSLDALPTITWSVRDPSLIDEPPVGFLLEGWEIHGRDAEVVTVEVAGTTGQLVSSPIEGTFDSTAHRLLFEHDGLEVIVTSGGFHLASPPDEADAAAEASLEHVLAAADDIADALDGAAPAPIDLDAACPAVDAPGIAAAGLGDPVVAARSHRWTGHRDQLTCSYATGHLLFELTVTGPDADGRRQGDRPPGDGEDRVELDGEPAIVRTEGSSARSGVEDRCDLEVRHGGPRGLNPDPRLFVDETDLVGREDEDHLDVVEEHRREVVLELLAFARAELACPAR